jgi:uncharacterized membrane protein YwaF
MKAFFLVNFQYIYKNPLDSSFLKVIGCAISYFFKEAVF